MTNKSKWIERLMRRDDLMDRFDKFPPDHRDIMYSLDPTWVNDLEVFVTRFGIIHTSPYKQVNAGENKKYALLLRDTVNRQSMSTFKGSTRIDFIVWIGAFRPQKGPAR
jgi:hypothetical protein